MILLIIGGINWGLVGLLDYDVVRILGVTLAKIVYILVGLSGVYMIFGVKNMFGGDPGAPTV